jgi:hypothetical protein
MDAIGIINDLFGHMAWADGVTWKAVLENPAAQADKELRERLLHMHLVQHAFLLTWQGMPLGPVMAATAYDLRALGDWARTYHAELPQFLATVVPAMLDQPMPLQWADKAAQRMGRAAAETPTLGETMLQVAAHSTHTAAR